MKIRTIVLSICLFAIPLQLVAQEITRDEFINSEWKMKADYYQKLLERKESGMLLDDRTDYDMKYWSLNLDITDISGQTISGIVSLTSESGVNNLTTVDYDLHSAMDVDSVLVGGQRANFTHIGSVLSITLDRPYNIGEQFTTTTFYGGHPPGGGFGSFTWDTHNGQPIISTLSEPEGAREWWPCDDNPHDKADSSDVYITTRADLVATSNGMMLSNVDNGDNTRTFHWHESYPITTYLVSLAISNYRSFTDWYVGLEGDSMPVTNYVYPEHYNQAVEDMSITPAAIAIYANLFGEYPFLREKYGMTIFPWGGAMEHQTNTSYGASLITGSHYYDWILVHELSHQWFGDMITCDTWPDIWMNEGFASYCEALYYEQTQGFEAYINYMRNTNTVYDPSGPIYNPDELFDGNTVYNKGSWVLHILRGVMGDSAFFAGMYGYANDPAKMYGTITTRGFQHVMEGFYGDSLGWFFDEWVWGMNRPNYYYSWMKQDLGNGQYEIFLHVRQAQNSPAPTVFTMPIKIYPRINNVDTVVTIWNDSRVGDYRFIVNGNPTALAFDKKHWILKESHSETYRLNIVTASLPTGYVNIAYNDTVEARGGTQPYNFNVQSGSLPAGLSLDQNTGVISGTPTVVGDYTFTIRVTDSSNPQLTDDQDFHIFIETQTGVVGQNGIIPMEYALLGNYPNPFNSSTVIKLHLSQPGHVSLDIYNMLGQHIEQLYNGYLRAGDSEIAWNGDTASSGVYFYRLTAAGKSETRKMILVK